MTNCHVLSDFELRAEELREEVREKLPYGNEWLNTPNERLGGQTPEQMLHAGGYDAVRNLVYSIFYIGVS